MSKSLFSCVYSLFGARNNRPLGLSLTQNDERFDLFYAAVITGEKEEMERVLKDKYGIVLTQHESESAKPDCAKTNNVTTTRNENFKTLIDAISSGQVDLKLPDFKKELGNLVATLMKATWLHYSNGNAEREQFLNDFKSDAVIPSAA